MRNVPHSRDASRLNLSPRNPPKMTQDIRNTTGDWRLAMPEYCALSGG